MAHMNGDHGGSTIAMVHHYLGLPGVEKAELVQMDRLGFNVQCTRKEQVALALALALALTLNLAPPLPLSLPLPLALPVPLASIPKPIRTPARTPGAPRA